METKIEFTLWGLNLLEPMAFVTNMIIVASCILSYRMIRFFNSQYAFYWKLFYVFFIVASFWGSLSHLFWNYWWFYGKIPSWTTGVIATWASGMAMLAVGDLKSKTKLFWQLFLLVKGVVVLTLAFYQWKFIYIALDTILTYVVFCGIYGYYLYNKAYKYLKFLVIGIVILLPSGFIFLLKIDLHEWMNREDLSHLLMAIAIYYFGKSVVSEGESNLALT
jgi:hypothetical protein